MATQRETNQDDVFEQELFGLITRYEDDALDDGGLRRLNELLVGFSAARELFNDICLQSLSIGEALTANAVSEYAVGQASGSRKIITFPRWALAAAAAVALLFATVYHFFPEGPSLQGGGGELASISEPLAVQVRGQTGSVTFLDGDGTPLTGDLAKVLSPGNVVVTHGPASSTILDYPDGSSIELGPHSRASFVDAGRKLVHLQRGELRANVQPQSADKPFGVLTPHAEITVVGTQFLVMVESDDTKVQVSEGRVQVKRLSDDRAVDISAEHEVVVSNEGELLVATLPPAHETPSNAPDGSSASNNPQRPPLKIGFNTGNDSAVQGSVALGQPASLLGRILDASGQPWPSVQVSIYANENARNAVAKVFTNSDGRFEIKIRMAGEIFVRVGGVIEIKATAQLGKKTNLGDLAP